MAIEAIIFDASDVLYDYVGIDERMFEVISDLSQRFKIGMITNLYQTGVNSHFDEAQLSFFDYVHTYDTEGMSKPDPRAFLFAAERLGVLATNCLYVDDQALNLRGAEDAGMQTILFENFENFQQTLQQILNDQE